MSPSELPPPPPACLERPHPSSQKGGTLIAEQVRDLETHLKLVADPDGYRPARCPRCGHDVLHAHDHRSRKLRGDSQWGPEIMVRRYRCMWCQARWQILPLLLARWLWRSWRVVERAVGLAGELVGPVVPRRTRARWQARLRSAARSLGQALAASGEAGLERVGAGVGIEGTRGQLVDAMGEQLAPVAAIAHRLVPGLRLM